jgi:hypothetical protein
VLVDDAVELPARLPGSITYDRSGTNHM